MIQEVADFKKYLKGFHHDNKSMIIGLDDMHLFWSNVDNDGWHAMCYKKRSTDPSWLPPRKRICMWKEDKDEKPLLPTMNQPKLAPFKHCGAMILLMRGKSNVKNETARAKDVQQKKGMIFDGVSK